MAIPGEGLVPLPQPALHSIAADGQATADTVGHSLWRRTRTGYGGWVGLRERFASTKAKLKSED